MRLGLLAGVAGAVVQFCLQYLPLTTRGSAWYAGSSLAGILLLAAMAFYGFYTSVGGGRFSEGPCSRSEPRYEHSMWISNSGPAWYGSYFVRSARLSDSGFEVRFSVWP